MPNLKFPPSVEIKRAIAAVVRTGIEIGSIEIHPRKIVVHPGRPADDKSPEAVAYELWKAIQGKDTSRLRHAAAKTDAPPTKSRR